MEMPTQAQKGRRRLREMKAAFSSATSWASYWDSTPISAPLFLILEEGIQRPFEIVFIPHAAGGSGPLEFLNAIVKISFIDDVVAVEHGSSFVPGDAHDDPFGNSGSGKIPHSKRIRIRFHLPWEADQVHQVWLEYRLPGSEAVGRPLPRFETN